MLSTIFLVGLLILFIAAWLLAKTRVRIYRHRIEGTGFFDNFWKNLLRAFSGKNLILIAASVAFTLLLVFTNWDKTIQDFFQAENPFGLLPPIVLAVGNYWHLFIGFAIFYAGQSTKNNRLILCGFATIQALMSGFLITSLLKILTGRTAPLRPGRSSFHFLKHSDNPADFNFSFWENMTEGLRLFWPSGHTSSAITFVAAICGFYSDKIWVFVLGYSLVLITGLTMIDGDYHWTSDVIAGAFIGQAIGWSIGKFYKQKYEKMSLSKQSITTKSAEKS